MSDVTLIFIKIIAGFSFLFGIIYIIGAIRTKQKNVAFIGISLIIVCLIALFMLAF
jgi:hypothetical protein